MASSAAGPDGPPLVSVVTPCYNGEAFVGETIESVLAQTHPRVEMLVIDDGSTDGSWDVIRSFGDRVAAVRQENRGLPATRNRGVAAAKGDLLLFLDADDVMDPDTVAALVVAQAGRPDVIAACPWRNLVRRDGAWVRVPPEVPFPPRGADPLAAWLEGEWIPGHAMLWPRALFERVGGYDESLTADEDGDVACRAFLAGARLEIASGGESLYRRHGAASVSMSHDVFSDHRFLSRMRVLEKVEAEARERGAWERYREPVGIAYHRLAQQTMGAQPELARRALERGERYAGARGVAPTVPGRVLVRLLGMERKERVVSALARMGLMTRSRREQMERRRLHARETEPSPAPGERA